MGIDTLFKEMKSDPKGPGLGQMLACLAGAIGEYLPMLLKRTPVALAVSLVLSVAAFAGNGSFVKNGDTVGFFGDSITEAKVYGQIVEAVFRHCHPEAKVVFVNNGHSGLQLAGTKTGDVVKGDPGVVTIMIGMNDAINAAWVRGLPIDATVEKYKSNLLRLVRELKAQGRRVVLFTPTLTDEGAEATTFRIEGTGRLLKAFGKVCEEVAKEESIPCVPVQSEFEDYQDSLPGFAQLRPDGVHPCARGHYQIARSVWTHLNFAGPLEGAREVSAQTCATDIKLSPTSNILPAESDAIEFAITTPKPGPAKLTWSSGQSRGSESLNLTGKDTWTLKLPKDALPQAAGKAVTVVTDIESGGSRQIFVTDVFRKTVIRGKDGSATGTVSNANKEPVASYLFRKNGKDLVFEAVVKKAEIIEGAASSWPWGEGDAITLFLDARKGADLGGLGYDGYVYQVWFRPKNNPFTPGFHPWAGKHMSSIETAYGEKTPDGYKVGLLLSGFVNGRERFDMSGRDFIAFDLSVIQAQAPGKREWLNAQTTERQNFLYPGNWILVDLTGKSTGDSALGVSTFPDGLAP